MTGHDPMLQRLAAWGEARDDVRVMILTSSRTNPNAPQDIFSDYDVIVAVRDIQPYLENEAWLGDFGPVLVMWRDPVKHWYGCEKFARITQYENGLKIDFTIAPVGVIRRMGEEAARNGTLDEDMNVGYRVLLDKDGLTDHFPPPTYRGYFLQPPTEQEYRETVEELLHEATYVAKNLWRDELMPAKYSLDQGMKATCLRRMLEWQIGIDHAWAIKAGALGKGLKKHLDPALWKAIEQTYVGAGFDENWRAIYGTIAIMRSVAQTVGQALGYTYPQEMDDRTMAYLRRVQAMERNTVQ